ncbi:MULTISPECIES: hypothetical protein [unclassified Algibacter]|uniref:hypothetical protein n=1 Tax=unclassified Algibacter TaxID=2615009 RepID=UPI00131E141B|nr:MULTISPECIES: hypothetical protein [unclassified Algibacter]MCL5129349.1 hypothetical protein [Algibacter sp. L4_22]
MRNYIVGFRKTDHFNHRQWDRTVNDKVISQLLKNVGTNKSNTLLIISRRVLKKINIKVNKELFIKIDNNTLITCFYCEFQEYYAGNREQNYLIISEI